MTDTPFYFSLEFASQGVPADLLQQLTAQVLQHVRCPAEAVPELTEALQRAVAGETSAGASRCDVQFRAGGGRLDIVVLANGGRVWQASRLLS